MIGGPLAGPDAGDESPLLAHVVGNLVRVVHNRKVEVREEEDQNNVRHGVQRLAPGKETHKVFDGSRKRTAADKQPDSLRESEQRHGEDDGHHAAAVDLERKVRRNPAHHAPSYDPFGVLNRDAPLAPLDQHDKGDDGQHESQQEHQGGNAPLMGDENVAVKLAHGPRQSHHDAGEDQQ